jgi:hypothetical protein
MSWADGLRNAVQHVGKIQREKGGDMKYLLAATGCILLSACTSMSDKAATVKDADREMVRKLKCSLLGNVSITTDTRGQSFAAGIDYAKNLAREDAADMGASHILWTDTERGFVSSVKGEAYNCGNDPR